MFFMFCPKAHAFFHGPHSQGHDTPRHVCIPLVLCCGAIDCDGSLARCGKLFEGRTMARSRAKSEVVNGGIPTHQHPRTMLGDVLFHYFH